MIVAVCGYGTSGASAVFDLLRGYDDLQFVPFEFQLIHQADGLLDLKYHLTENRERVACNAAIKRFKKLMFSSVTGNRISKIVGKDYKRIVNAFLDKIVLSSWKGRSNYDPVDISDRSRNRYICFCQQSITYLLRKINSSWSFPNYRTRYFSIIDADTFDKAAREFIDELFHAAGFDLRNNLILDMLLSATNPSKGMEFFYDIKVILVTRDPRDTYIRSRENVFLNSFMPQNSVDDFCTFYRVNREMTIMNEQAMLVHYEDLIYKYQETKEQIKKFLGYTKDPENEFKFFNPNVSVKYTKMLDRYPQFSEDIKYIEEHLKDYLYSFEEYKPLNVTRKYEGKTYK